MERKKNMNGHHTMTMWILILVCCFCIGRGMESMPLTIKRREEEISMGTTIVSVKYKDGCIMGADTRTSVSGYVSNRLATKLTCVLDRQMDSIIVPYNNNNNNNNNNSNNEYVSTCCIGRSGSAADTQYLADAVRNELLKRQTNRGLSSLSSSLSIITISNIARILQMRIMMQQNNHQYSASLICAGYDAIFKQGVIYSIMPGGTCMEETKKGWAISGSGSTYITGYIMDHYKPNMTETDAIQFIQKALSFAIDRDGSSGGMIRITIMNSNGKRQFITNPIIHNNPNTHTNHHNNDESRNSKLFAPPIVYKQSKSTIQ